MKTWLLFDITPSRPGPRAASWSSRLVDACALERDDEKAEHRVVHVAVAVAVAVARLPLPLALPPLLSISLRARVVGADARLTTALIKSICPYRSNVT